MVDYLSQTFCIKETYLFLQTRREKNVGKFITYFSIGSSQEIPGLYLLSLL